MNVSVVIPLYNKAATLERALSSALGQAYAPAEILVIDDGSTDGGGARVQSVADPRVRLIRQTNGGVSAARNRGVHEAQSDWVAFLDADDEWLPGFLDQLCSAARQDPDVGTVFSNMRLSNSNTAWLGGQRGGRLDNYFDFFVAHQGHGMSSSSTLVKRRLLQQVGGFPQGVTHGEDLDTWARLAWEAPVAYVAEVLAIYHVTGSPRAMDVSHTVIAAGLQRCLRSARDRLRQHRVSPSLRRATRSYAQMLALMVARELKDAGDGRGAFESVLEAFPPAASARDIHFYATALVRSLCPAGLLAIQRRCRQT